MTAQTNPARIPVAAAVLNGNEKKYVMDCLDSTWISSAGEYVNRFEREFAQYAGAQHAVSCCNGTVALHLALLALDIQPGDEVLVPTLTFVATANAVTYCGAVPVMVDSEPDTWCMDPKDVEAKVTPRTKAILAVHLYGHPANMPAINAIAKRHGLRVIEDAAEAHGAEVEGRRVGALADIATFSFYGNKIITTGEGGMITTDDAAIAARMRLLRGQGMDPNRRYWFPIIGYNYRLTNVAAAIGVAQLENVQWHMDRRREVAAWYMQTLAGSGVTWQPEAPWARHAYWMFTVLMPAGIDSTRVRSELDAEGIETRPVFVPMHQLPPYLDAKSLPVAEDLAKRGINLPTWAGLTRDDVKRVVDRLKAAIARQARSR